MPVLLQLLKFHILVILSNYSPSPIYLSPSTSLTPTSSFSILISPPHSIPSPKFSQWKSTSLKVPVILTVSRSWSLIFRLVLGPSQPHSRKHQCLSPKLEHPKISDLNHATLLSWNSLPSLVYPMNTPAPHQGLIPKSIHFFLVFYEPCRNSLFHDPHSPLYPVS
jgi:hypothetical protein